MNLGFKRIMSGILAFVMMFSTLVISNVASVSAASSDFYLTADDFYDGVTPSTTKTAPVLSAAATAAELTVDTKSTNYYSVFGTRAGDDVTNNTGKEFTNEVRLGGSREIKFTPASNGTVNAYVYVNDSNASGSTKKTVAIGAVTTTLTTGRTVIVATGAVSANTEASIKISGDVCLLALEYVSSSETYTWSLNTDNLVNVDKTKVSIDTTATGATNTLSYSGTDYVVKNSALAEGVTGVTKEDNAFTVTVTDDMFLPVTEGINISVANAGGLDLVLTGTNNGYKYTLTLDENGAATGIALVQDTYTLSIAGGDLSYTSVVVDGSTTAIDLVYTKDEVVTLVHKFDIASLATGDITESTIIDDGAFKLYISGTNKFTVEANTKDITIADGTTVSAAKRLKFNGTGGVDKRAIVFTPAASGDIYFYALAGGSSGERMLTISDGTEELASSAALSSSTFDPVKFTVEANKTYYVYATGNGVNVHYIASTFDFVAQVADETTTEATTATETTTVTTTVTETTTEVTTAAETQPEETTEASEGQLAAGEYTLNRNTSVTGLNVSNANELASSAIKINSTTYIEFTPAIDGVLTVTYGNKAPKLVTANDTETVLATGSGTTLTANVTGGVTYRIYGTTTSNSNLSKLVLAVSNEDETTYTISGKVTDADTGLAIENATVTAGTLFAQTLADGTYTITVDKGVTIDSLIATADGYVEDAYIPDEAIADTTTHNFALNAETVDLTVTGTIKGSDTDAGLSGAEVTVTIGSSIKSVTSDANGVYTAIFTVLPSELATLTATVAANATGYDESDAVVTGVAVDGTITQDIILTLTEETPVSGDKVYNFTDGGEKDTDFFTIVGTPASVTGKTYGDLSLDKGLTLGTDTTGAITFTTTGTSTVTIVTSVANGKYVLLNGTKTTAATDADGVLTITGLEAGTYTITKSNPLAVLYIKVSEEGGSGSTIDPFDLTVNVTDGTSPVTDATIVINGVKKTATYDEATGTYTVAGLTSAVTSVEATADGYSSSVVTGLNITAADTVVVTLAKRTDVTVVFTVAGVKAGSAISIKNSSTGDTGSVQNAGSTATFTANAGDKFTFSSSANNVYMWEVTPGEISDIKAYNKTTVSSTGSKSYTRNFNYTVPSDAVGGTTYTVTFTAETNVANKISYTNNNMEDLVYGQYGFGDDKAALCGNDAAEHMDVAFATPTMKDYAAGFSDVKYNDIDQTSTIKTGNQYAIISKNTTETSYVKFKIADAITLGLDEGSTVNVTIDLSGAVTVAGDDSTSYSLNGKTTLALTPGVTYTITDTKGTSYIKSIRLFNPNNVFNNLDKTLTNNVYAYSASELDDDTLAALGTDSTDARTIFRIIGQIVLDQADQSNPDAALSSINAIGFDVYDKADYDAATAQMSADYYYNEAKQSLLNAGYTAPDVDEIVFDDVVNSAVDLDNDGTPDIGHLLAEATGEDLYVQTYFASATDKTLIPWVIYEGTTEKVYSECPKSGSNVNVDLVVE